jgi:hypothetical protein
VLSNLHLDRLPFYLETIARFISALRICTSLRKAARFLVMKTSRSPGANQSQGWPQYPPQNEQGLRLLAEDAGLSENT